MEDLVGDVAQDAVAQLDGVVQPQECHGSAIPAREILEHPLAPEDRLRILSDRPGRVRFRGSFASRGPEGVDVSA